MNENQPKPIEPEKSEISELLAFTKSIDKKNACLPEVLRLIKEGANIEDIKNTFIGYSEKLKEFLFFYIANINTDASSTNPLDAIGEKKLEEVEDYFQKFGKNLTIRENIEVLLKNFDEIVVWCDAVIAYQTKEYEKGEPEDIINWSNRTIHYQENGNLTEKNHLEEFFAKLENLSKRNNILAKLIKKTLEEWLIKQKQDKKKVRDFILAELIPTYSRENMARLDKNRLESEINNVEQLVKAYLE